MEARRVRSEPRTQSIRVCLREKEKETGRSISDEKEEGEVQEERAHMRSRQEGMSSMVGKRAL